LCVRRRSEGRFDRSVVAGVALAAVIPAARPRGEDTPSLLSRMEHGLHPWVMFGILPVFAFANAGVPLKGSEFSDLLAPVPLGIALGLFLGKPVGIVAASWLAVRYRVAQLPAGVGWWQVCGIAMLCGIGFTMSLFIGSLAFEAQGGTGYAMDDRLGILSGSLLSAVSGIAVLLLAHRIGEAVTPAAVSDEKVVVTEEGCGSTI
jgi:NhaA family Na+:H+ antiporter